MKLTKEEAIANHRKMWNWIADETERLERIVSKAEYFQKHNISNYDIPPHSCYCCAFDLQYWALPLCGACPINWGVNTEITSCIIEESAFCSKKESPFRKWVTVVNYYPDDWERAAKFAREIANLPEREE